LQWEKIIPILAELSVIVLIVFLVANIQYKNGMIVQCEKFGRVMTSKMECVSCIEANLWLVNGSCQRPPKGYGILDLDTQLDNFEEFKRNGTIL
jgi:hypothetical protein